MVFIINFLVVILYYVFLRVCVPQYYNKFFAVVVAIHTVTFKALADPYNFVDTQGYVIAFKNLAHIPFEDILLGKCVYIDWGYGYVLLNKLVACFTNNQYLLYVSFAILGIPPVIWFYYKTSYSLLFSVLMFLAYPMLYRMGFGVVRQHLSIAYLLPSLYFIDKPKKSVLLALIATSLHTSSSLFFFYYVWRYIYYRLNSRQMKVLYIVAVAVGVKLLFSVGTLLFSRYTSYAMTEGNNNYSPALLIGLFVYFAFLNYHYLMLDKQDEEILCFMTFGFSMALGSIGLPLGRFTLMFMYVLCSAFTIFKKYSCGSMLKYSVWLMAFTLITLWQMSDARLENYELWLLK